MRETIMATDRHVLTNGKIYGRIIYLAEGMDAAAFHEITEEEYKNIIDEASGDILNDTDFATEEDFVNALGEMGVQL